MTLFITLFYCLLSYGMLETPVLQNDYSVNTNSEVLIVFYQETDRIFLEKSLPKIKELAQRKAIQLVEKKPQDGLPKEITSTPAIIYQNEKGRSIYAGRYVSFSSIVNFIRTAKYVPQQAAEFCKEEVLTWKKGRTTIIAPVKITTLSGSLPADFQATRFKQQAMKAVQTALEDFKKSQQTCLERTDRSFYFDFHPYQTADGQLFLSYELYAQFSCITPVFSSSSKPIAVAFDQYENAFSQAALLMEKELKQQLKSSVIGDAISMIEANVPIVNWEQLGLDLPEKEVQKEEQKGLPVPTQWTYAGPVDAETPALQFRFPAPLDRYAGELKKLNGQMAYDRIKGMEGRFEVATKSLTMGMPDLDVKVLKKYIKAKKFPKASFRFKQEQALPQLRFGESATIKVPGIFELMKIKKNIEVDANLNLVLDEEGALRLLVQVAFDLNITDDFGIAGPDGPEPAKKMVECFLIFYMKGI